MEYGRYKESTHYWLELTAAVQKDYSDELEKGVTYRMASPSTGGKNGYTGDFICSECHKVKMGHEYAPKIISSVKILINKYPKPGDEISASDFSLPNGVELVDIGWRIGNNTYYVGDTIEEKTIDNLSLVIRVKPSFGYWFYGYDTEYDDSSITYLTSPLTTGIIAGKKVTVNGYLSTQTNYGVLRLTYENVEIPNGFVKEDGNTYYYENGVKVTKWHKIGSSWYYFNSEGVMQTGWQQLSGKWYYFNESGVMQTGWLQLGKYWYYFTDKGVMVTGTVVIGGKTYTFSSTGVWKK